MNRVTFWLDNCSSQNKNWSFFLYMILLVNSQHVHIKEVTLKFFESGHTFMAADSFHAAVERAMRNGSRTYTFPDFRDAVQRATKKVEVIDMQVADFFDTKYSVSPHILKKCNPRPYIENIRKVIFKRGSYEMQYSSSIDETGTLLTCDIISNKQRKIILSSDRVFNLECALIRRQEPVGINMDRKHALMTAILPVIPDDKKNFWTNLPETKETSE